MFDVTGAEKRFSINHGSDMVWFDNGFISEELVDCINQAFHAVEYFCEQVECGNFQSVNTYHKFNDILLRSGWREDEA